jgi:cyanophycin synthetase
VPPAGKQVLIQRNGNVAFDVTAQVHPSVAATASLAARIVGLDIAGVDLVAEDISQPLAGQRGAIVEVNAGPGLLMHLKPASGEPQPVGRAIVDSLFPADDNGRIPIVGVAGGSDMTVVARLVAWLLHLAGKYVGLACADGMFLDHRQVETGDCATWQASHRLMLNRSVEAAVFENGCRMILGEGLAYDKCTVGVVTNVGSAAGLEAFDVRQPDQVFNVLRTQVDIVLPDGVAVLNADDEQVADMARLCDGDVIFYGTDAASPVIAKHRAEGKRAVVIRDGRVVLAAGKEENAILAVAAIPPTALPAGKAGGVLAAIGAAWALNVSPDLIRAGIETFETGQAAPPKARTQRPRKTQTI